jgi:hypothetical protein
MGIPLPAQPNPTASVDFKPAAADCRLHWMKPLGWNWPETVLPNGIPTEPSSRAATIRVSKSRLFVKRPA